MIKKEKELARIEHTKVLMKRDGSPTQMDEAFIEYKTIQSQDIKDR
jgi:hypothetical protein